MPIFDEQRRLVGVTLMLADVTRLRRPDEVKTVISTVSHELKTPLTSVRLAIHVLLSDKIGPLSAKQTEVLEAAREDSDRLNRVIEDLLDISRIESGRAEIRLATDDGGSPGVAGDGEGEGSSLRDHGTISTSRCRRRAAGARRPATDSAGARSPPQ